MCGGECGEACAWELSRSSRRDHVEASSSGMEPGAAFNQAVSPHCLVGRSPENMIMRAILKMDHG